MRYISRRELADPLSLPVISFSKLLKYLVGLIVEAVVQRFDNGLTEMATTTHLIES
jgi:hypothetical protein